MHHHIITHISNDLSHESYILIDLCIALDFSVGPWCFDYPRYYTGQANVTVGGLPCRRWDSLPLDLSLQLYFHFSWSPNEDIEKIHNYCRNPDGDIWPWCFTEDLDVPYDFCSVEDLVCHPDEKLWKDIVVIDVESSTVTESAVADSTVTESTVADSTVTESAVADSLASTDPQNESTEGHVSESMTVASSNCASVPRLGSQIFVAVGLYGIQLVKE